MCISVSHPNVAYNTDCINIMSSWLFRPDPKASPQNMESVGETVSVFASPNLVQVKYSTPAIAAIYLNQFGQWPQETLIFSLIIPLLTGS